MSAPLALTLGEPAGIGPDITIAAWRRRGEFGLPPFYAVVDADFLAQRAERLQLPIRVTSVEPEAAAAVFASALPVVSLGMRVTAQPGRPDHSSAPAAIASIRRAVADVMAGRAAALVTNPVAKAVLYQAGFSAPGHTEYLAQLAQQATGKPTPTAMMLWSPELAVVPVTIHLPLREVPGRLTVELIVDTARIVARDLEARFGMARPLLPPPVDDGKNRRAAAAAGFHPPPPPERTQVAGAEFSARSQSRRAHRPWRRSARRRDRDRDRARPGRTDPRLARARRGACGGGRTRSALGRGACGNCSAFRRPADRRGSRRHAVRCQALSRPRASPGGRQPAVQHRDCAARCLAFGGALAALLRRAGADVPTRSRGTHRGGTRLEAIRTAFRARPMAHRAAHPVRHRAERIRTAAEGHLFGGAARPARNARPV